MDAAQGIQAQTLAHFATATKLGAKIIPIINKVDLPNADPDAVELQMMSVLNIQEEPLRISAKSGLGIDKVVQKIIDSAKVPDVPE